jgi:hypothetical protein
LIPTALVVSADAIPAVQLTRFQRVTIVPMSTFSLFTAKCRYTSSTL